METINNTLITSSDTAWVWLIDSRYHLIEETANYIQVKKCERLWINIQQGCNHSEMKWKYVYSVISGLKELNLTSYGNSELNNKHYISIVSIHNIVKLRDVIKHSQVKTIIVDTVYSFITFSNIKRIKVDLDGKADIKNLYKNVKNQHINTFVMNCSDFDKFDHDQLFYLFKIAQSIKTLYFEYDFQSSCGDANYEKFIKAGLENNMYIRQVNVSSLEYSDVKIKNRVQLNIKNSPEFTFLICAKHSQTMNHIKLPRVLLNEISSYFERIYGNFD